MRGAWLDSLSSKNSKDNFENYLDTLRPFGWRRIAFPFGGSPPPARLFLHAICARALCFIDLGVLCFIDLGVLNRSRRFQSFEGGLEAKSIMYNASAYAYDRSLIVKLHWKKQKRH